MTNLLSVVTMLGQVVLGVVLLLAATIVFDGVHVLLHRLAASRQPVLARIGALHTVHHEFLDRRLMLHEDKLWANVFHHVLPEFLVQVLVTLALSPLFPSVSVITALILEAAVLVFILWGKPGIDVNHKQVERLLPYQPLYFCVPEYHLLHHVFPDAHFSSWIKTLDHWLGTGLSLQNRRVWMTDQAAPFSRAFSQALNVAGCIVEGEGAIREASILLLCHDLSGEDYPLQRERFHQAHQADRFPVEVWEVLDDRAPAAAMAERVKQQFTLQQVIYRQLWLNAQRSDDDNAQQLLKKLRRGDNIIRVN